MGQSTSWAIVVHSGRATLWEIVPMTNRLRTALLLFASKIVSECAALLTRPGRDEGLGIGNG